MGYSLRKQDYNKDKQSEEFTYFSEQEWDEYQFATNEDMQWFRNAKFGLFLHVGISAVGMVDISWPRATHKLPDRTYSSSKIKDEVYDGWANKIKFENFDAKQWAKIAKNGGFKYVVIITKHHDGFHMWDTQHSEYKITNSPFGRDYLKEILDAFRSEGLKIGLYYSKRDWKHPDYEPVPVADAHAINKAPYFEMNEGKSYYVTEKHARYQKYMFNTVRELMQNYGKIDVLWWDAVCNGGMFTQKMWNSKELEKMVRELQPHIIINNRASLPGDFDTPEGHIGFFQNTRMWETCMPLGCNWAYSKGPIRSVKTILKQLLNCVGGDGNYLLSIGCKPDGTISDKEQKTINKMGEWLEKYGQSVYSTRGGIWKPTSKYVACFNNNVVYLHLFNSMLCKGVDLPFANNKLTKATTMTGEQVIAKVENNRLKLSIKHKKLNSPIIIIRLQLSAPPTMEE